MWAGGEESPGPEGPIKSDIACHSCRKRKIRCGRERPHCNVCERTSQVCEYPTRILKPGPKIGSSHRSRKRPRENRNAIEILSREETPTQEDQTDRSSRNEAVTSRDNVSQKNQEPVMSSRKHASSLDNPDGQNQCNVRRDSLNIHDLSFILHPIHDSTSEKDALSVCSPPESEKSMMVARACYALNVTAEELEKMINMYFDNMTAINIFHEPTFRDKIQNIASPSQIHALLASMLGFSARFCAVEDSISPDSNPNVLSNMHHTSAYFLGLASRFIDEALRECGDEAPPLCLLQALVLLAHGQLTQGVRGKAWRSLGTCVRLAYELNLHLVDFGHPRNMEDVDPKQWCDHEEKRRVWWAIWEMDVFASTIRRCPTAVDWSQIETLLPIEDEYWFQCRPRNSCFLEADFVRRWKALQESGNQSPKAWFIVVNSLMKQAQSISSPRGVPNLGLPDERRQTAKSRKHQKEASSTAEEARERLETISNSVRCFVLALPPRLRYRNQYLGFDPRQPGQTTSLRQHHCGLYNIYMMTQLAKLMIYHYDVFKYARDLDKQGSRNSWPKLTAGVNDVENMALNQYFEAADNILTLVHRSCDDHIQYINAFLASTIWLASAVQLVRKEFGPQGTNRALVKSKFEVLSMTYNRCVAFWDIETAMQQNLESLEEQLEGFRIGGNNKEDQILQPSERSTTTKQKSWTNGSSDQERHHSSQSHSSEIQSVTGLPSSLLQDTSTATLDRKFSTIQGPQQLMSQNLSPPSSTHNTENGTQQRLQDEQQQQQGYQVSPLYLEPISPATSSLDFMHLPQHVENKQTSNRDLQMPANNLIDPMLFQNSPQRSQFNGIDSMQGLAFGLHIDGSNAELPSYIDELLSGACMY